MPEDLTKWIYPDEKMVEGTCPSQIYIPNKVIMFKIMRSCIGMGKTQEVGKPQEEDLEVNI